MNFFFKSDKINVENSENGPDSEALDNGQYLLKNQNEKQSH